MPKARWPNLDIDQPYEMYVELEHVMSFISQFWHHRAGHAGTRAPDKIPRNVCIIVGQKEGMLEAENLSGGPAGTPLLARRSGYKMKGESRESLNSAGQPRLCNGKRPVAPLPGAEVTKVYSCPDFVLVGSPVLQDMYQSARMAQYQSGSSLVELGPICRQQELFGAVLALLKLRWLARLHAAAILFGGSRCSLQRFLKGVLADCSDAHEFPHLPMPYFDAVAENLQGHLEATWPLFIAHLGRHDLKAEPPSGPNNAPSWRNAMPGGAAPMADPSSSNIAVDQLVDDIFVAWVAQQRSSELPVELLLQELDHFQIRRPVLRSNVEGLRCWSLARSQTKYRYVKVAQQQAHHLALVLDMPPLWSEWHSREEVLEMARNVVAHPRTFNTGVRARVAALLTDTATHMDKTGAICPSYAKTATKDQMSLFHSFLASPRDMGRVDPGLIEKLSMNAPSWLVGTSPIFSDTSKFHSRMAQTSTPGGHTLPPIEAGTPRAPQVTVRLS